MTTTVTHRPNCRGPRITARVRTDGSAILRCTRCKSSEAIPPGAVAQAFTAITGKYRCRDHHDEVVTWRGKGCRECTPQLIPSS